MTEETTELQAQPYSSTVERSGPCDRMPNPTEAMLADPLWEAIWQTIKSWDVNVPEHYNGYCGANGSHATLIFNAITRPAAVDADGVQHTEDCLRSTPWPTHSPADCCTAQSRADGDGGKCEHDWKPVPNWPIDRCARCGDER